MKKLISNRSGFTLIEIVVAFAIFAILASMILSMVRITVMQRNANNEFTKELQAQTQHLAGYSIKDTEKFSGSDIVVSGKESVDGTLKLNFGSGIGSYSFNYGLRGADVDLDDSSNNKIIKTDEGLNFFVAEGVTYNSTGDTPPADNNKSTGGKALTAQTDTRIYGSRYLDYVLIKNVEVDEGYTGAGTRVIITSTAEPMFEVPANEAKYLQYRLHFSYPYGSTADGTYTMVPVPGEDGTDYERKVYNDIPIIECGYVETDVAGNVSFKDHRYNLYNTSGDINPYEIVQTSKSNIRVSIPSVSTGLEFSSGKETIMYVILDAELDADDIDSTYFGEACSYQKDGKTEKHANVEVSGTECRYYKYPNDPLVANYKDYGSNRDKEWFNDGKYLNVYGAFQYEETEAKESK